VTHGTRAHIRRSYLGAMKPLHVIVLLVAVLSVFALTLLVAAPEVLGF
jgi:hypothetical protein